MATADMSKSKEDEVRIPDVIIDTKNNKKYQKCSFLGKVTIVTNIQHLFFFLYLYIIWPIK